MSLEWPETLDAPELLATGWNPVPFEEFVVKIHSRCDLACDYCYMFNSVDSSWRHQPSSMSFETIDQVVSRIIEHSAGHSLSRIRVILHGGEPLLAGPERLEYLVTRLYASVPECTSAQILLQTNGMHLTEANLALLCELGIQVGVSLDGTQPDHDRHRRRPNKSGSYEIISRNIDRLINDPYAHLFRGLLCVIDLAADPISTYRALRKFDPPAMDFILPHGNWSNPPSGRTPESRETPYADWLLTVFDEWYSEPEQKVSIRIFEEIINGILTGRVLVEGLGLGACRIAVIDTDGSIGQSDFLRTAYDGADRTGLHVSTDRLDAALLTPPFAARQLGSAALCEQCQSCPILQVCGGGHYAHRYRAGTGFRNPSVYCADLTKLIGTIQERLVNDILRMQVVC
jgi:uncharacterized protein